LLEKEKKVKIRVSKKIKIAQLNSVSNLFENI